jgi:hypothetical protein
MSREFFDKWKSCGLPAFAAIIAPWQNKLTEIALISEWFQPGLNTLASLLGPLACLLAFSFLKPRSRAKRVSFSLRAAIVFLISLFICFSFNFSIGTLWIPTPREQFAIWIVWIAAYLTLFVTLALCIVGATLAIPDDRPPASERR